MPIVFFESKRQASNFFQCVRETKRNLYIKNFGGFRPSKPIFPLNINEFHDLHWIWEVE